MISSNKNINTGVFSTIVMLFMLVCPIMNMYAIFGGYYLDIFIEELLIVSFLFFCCFNKKVLSKELSFPRMLKIYFIYYFIVYFVSNIKVGFYAMLSLPVFLAFFLYLTFWGTFVSKRFINIYIIFAVISISFYFAQLLVETTTGIGLSGVIPGLPLSEGVPENINERIYFSTTRYSAFFSEPSHFAQFLLPLLIILLFDKPLTIRFKKPLILAIISALLLLQSGTAIVGIVPILIFLLISFWKEHPKQKPLVLLFLMLLVCVIGFVIKKFIDSEIGSFIIERSDEFDMTAIDGTSGFVRMWRGFYVYDDYSMVEKIFGNCCLEDQIRHVKASHMEMNFEGFALTYFSGIQTILIRTGIIGFVLFSAFLRRLWIDNTICGKCLLVTCITLMFVDATYLTTGMAVYLLLAQCQKQSLRSERLPSPKLRLNI